MAKQEKWPATLNVIGTVAAVQGVTVSADLPGTVDRINFESGKSVNAGDVLVELDTRQERAQLAAAEAQRDLARINFDRMQELVKQGVIRANGVRQRDCPEKRTEAQVGEIRATIARKTIRAPFSGILGIRQVNLGQYLSAGEAIVPLQSLNPIYVNFGVPQQAAADVAWVGAVGVTTDDVARADFTGRVTALDSVVERGDPQRSGAGDAGESWRQAASWHVRPGQDRHRSGPVRSSRCRRRRSITLRTAIRCTSSRILKTRAARPTAACASSS